MKRLFSITAAAVIAAGAAPAAAIAADAAEAKTAVVSGVTYTYTVGDTASSGITITKASPAEGKLVLPEAIGGQTVTGIGDKAFLGQTGLKEVTLPSGLRTIGSSAFSACISITHLDIPDSVQLIKEKAFMSCYALTDVSIGKGVKELPDDCFFSCTSLAGAKLPDGLQKIGNEAFFGCPVLDTFIPASVKEIGTNALGYRTDAHSAMSVQVNGFIVNGAKGSSAETYAAENGLDFLDPDNCLIGDINNDNMIDAKDASAILAEYARASTGAETSFSPWQKKIGDIKSDGIIDANDASRVLMEYARLSTLPDSSL